MIESVMPPAPGATAVAAAAVLRIGDPRLRQVSREVTDFADPAFRAEVETLQATLSAFRREYGFGRAISAPQIGIGRRFIAVNLGEGPFLVANPEVTWRSEETFTMWDDCMSFPSLLVRVRRYSSLSLRYRDGGGEPRTWERLDQAASELLQHEIDHLDGVLFVDRAIDRDSFVHREAFDAEPRRFIGQVDYVIGGPAAT
jgi:peptide deformylase